MKQLTVELKNTDNLGYYGVFIDGNAAAFKKNGGKLTCTHKTEKDSVKVDAVRYLNCGGILWFITQLLLFVVSVFGLFEGRQRNKHIALEFSQEVETAEYGHIQLNFLRLKDGAPAVKTAANTPTQEFANRYYANGKVKRIYRVLLVAKIFTAIAVVAAVIASVLAIIIL